MFGSLRIDKERLAGEHRDLYRASFCGACHAMRELGGRSTSLLTNYDQTVLALVLAGLDGGRAGSTPRAACTAMPLRRVSVQSFSPGARQLLAAANLAAVDAKIRDDLDDETGRARLRARLGRRWLGRATRRAYRALDAASTTLFADLPARQTRAEASPSPTLETLAAPSAEVCAAMFGSAADATGRVRHRPRLRAFGAALGRFIYAWDAWLDQAGDAQHGRFNALAACLGGEPDRTLVRGFLERQLADASAARRAVPLGAHGEILDALLASLRRKVAAALPMAWPLRDARPAEAGDCDCGVCEICSCCDDGSGAAECFLCGEGCRCGCDACLCCDWSGSRRERRRSR